MNNQSIWRSGLETLGVYVAWVIAIALSGVGFWLLRSAISQWYIVLSLPPNAHKAIDRSLLLFGGALWVFMIFYIEGYLRQGIKRHNLGHRLRVTFARLGGFVLVGALLLWSVQWLG